MKNLVFPLNRCHVCERPVAEKLSHGRCRICANLNWRVKGIAPTPISDSGDCPRCDGRSKRVWGRAYCKPCETVYMNQWRKLDRAKRRLAKAFSGVDIDAVHRNPRWMKIKKAA